jgi:WD40 repeat protein
VKNFDSDYYNAFKSKSSDVRSLQFVQDKYLYTTGTSGRINAWEVENMAAKRSIVIFDEEGVFVKKIFVDENNQKLVALTDGSDFYVIDISEKSRIYDMEVIGDNLLATGNNNGKIEIWDTNEKKSKITIREANNKYIHSLAMGNGILAAGDNSGQVTLFYLDENFNTKNSISLRGSDGEIMTDITFNAAENQVISASKKGVIRMWNLQDPDEFPMIINEPGSWVNAIALMDKNHIFAGCKDQVFRLYPIKSEILAETLKSKLSRDITAEEWDRYIGDDLPYEPIFDESIFKNQSR